jgi:hypothetical protein
MPPLFEDDLIRRKMKEHFAQKREQKVASSFNTETEIQKFVF